MSGGSRPFLELGFEARFVHLGVLRDELAACGIDMDDRRVREWMKRLGVTILWFPSKQGPDLPFVDRFTLAVALRSVARIGRPDFYAPGTRTARTRGSGLKGTTRTKPPSPDELDRILAEVVITRRWAGAPTRYVKKAVEEAAAAIAQAGKASLSQKEQEDLATRLVARMKDRHMHPSTVTQES